MLKIFALSSTAAALETHVFSFTSPTAARVEADSIKDAISKAIQTAKGASDVGTSTTAGSQGAQASAALAMASAVSTPAADKLDPSGWYDDRRLKSDVELQKSLLKADPLLQKTFMESLRTKPDSISNAEFTTQFWSTRLHLLRAHAIEKNQSRGAYNVLSTIKSKTEDNVTRLSISKEQIQLIFNQYPLVKRVYDENVPNLNETAFWSKFFLSRLFKKLKGEKIVESDPLDPIIDKYLRYDEDPDRNQRILGAHIPHIIDIEGNEENHSQRRGNQPDLTMRPTSIDKVPIIRTLNNLSERIMASVAPVDVDPSQPIGMNEETFRELALRDLEADAQENRIILNIKNQQRFFSDGKEKTGTTGTPSFPVLSPAEVLAKVQIDLGQSSLRSGSGGMNLEGALGIDEESDDEDDMAQEGPVQVGSKPSLAGATRHILETIKQRRLQNDDVYRTSQGISPNVQSNSGMSAAISDRISLTHATSTEFLHYFWAVFLSGNPDRANEVGKLAESLDRALERIDAVARDAEDERTVEIEQLKQEARDLYQATGKKVKVRPDAVDGGERVVREMLGPTVRALEFAVGEYRKALAREEAGG